MSSSWPWSSHENYGKSNILREWVPKCESFLQLLLQLEAPPYDLSCHHCKLEKRNVLFWCSNCIGDWACCHACLLVHHSLLPFHRIKMWNGKHFAKTMLQDQGHMLHLGHLGGICPETNDAWVDIATDGPIPEDADPPQDILGSNQKDVVEDNVVNIVHTTGIFKHKVRWCQCPNAPHKIM